MAGDTRVADARRKDGLFFPLSEIYFPNRVYLILIFRCRKVEALKAELAEKDALIAQLQAGGAVAPAPVEPAPEAADDDDDEPAE
eukprot:SAG11_NODE_2510_length_3270_cov_4.113844_3_plen_85_part_00